MNQKHSFSSRRRVQFAETDMAGIVHFSNFFRFMEETEHAFYRELGFSVHPKKAEVAWPRVHASCDYKLPLRFEEEFEIELLVKEVRAKTIRYTFRFWKDPDGDRLLAASGEVVVVAVSMRAEDGTMNAVRIPESVLEKIAAAPEDLNDSE